MAKFRDKYNRDWTIEPLTVGAVEKLQTDADFSLDSIMDGGTQGLPMPPPMPMSPPEQQLPMDAEPPPGLSPMPNGAVPMPAE